MSSPNISIGILSWGSPLTLRNTLQSYKQSGLFDLTDDVFIFFQEQSETDIQIARDYGITKILGSTKNIGIGQGFKALAVAAKYDYLLLLENDWVDIEDKEINIEQLYVGLHLLEKNIGDVVKYRHRARPGAPLYTRQFMGRELDAPTHMGDAHHWLPRPAVTYPQYFQHVGNSANSEYYIISSGHCCFTNNPCMYRKEFYLDKIAPFATGMTLEAEIQPWWEQQHFKVVLGNGLFTHERLDR